MNAVIFDFNGTLFDDTSFHITAWKNYFQRKFQLSMSEDEVRRHCVGPDNQTIFRSLLGDSYSQAELELFSREKEKEYRSEVYKDKAHMQLVSGATELFDLLKARNMPFALATSSIYDNVMFYLHDLGLKRWFDWHDIVYEEGKLKSKPEPDFYIEAARRVGFAPQDCIVVEDSPTGIAAASRAAIGRIIAIENTHTREALKAAGRIDAFVHDFRCFEQFL